VLRAGNPNLLPRRAWVVEGTLERQFWTGGSVVLTVRRLALRDVVDQRPLPGFGPVTIVGNIGDGSQTDVVAIITLPLKRLGLDGMNLKSTATWRSSRVIDPTTGEPRRLSGQAAFSGELHFSHDLPDWKLVWGVDASYTGPNSAYWPTQIQRIGGQVRVSAFAERRIRTDLSLRVEGLNLNDLRTPWVIDTYAGLRGQAPLLYTEARRPGDGPVLFVRLRKTLGG
jgi:outer membrane receptor protein involved in Fe transport